MQQALCLKCGELKEKPLAACAACGHQPASNRDQAEHLLAASFEFDAGQLAAAQAHIKDGGSLEFAPDALSTTTAALKADKADPHWLLFWFVIVAPATALVLWYVFAD